MFLQAEWLCLNCQTQRALSGQLGDMGKMPLSSSASVKAEPTVNPKTEISKPPAPSPKPSPEKHVEEVQAASTDVKTIVTTSAVPAAYLTLTNAASTVTHKSVAPVSIDGDDKEKVERALKDMLGTAVDEGDLTASIPSVESQRYVITAAEVLKETDKIIEAFDNVVKVEHHIQVIEVLHFFV